jgi:hypothetical protein
VIETAIIDGVTTVATHMRAPHLHIPEQRPCPNRAIPESNRWSGPCLIDQRDHSPNTRREDSENAALDSTCDRRVQPVCVGLRQLWLRPGCTTDDAVAGAGPDAHPSADTDTNADADTNADTNADTDADANTHADADANANTHADADANANTHADATAGRHRDHQRGRR